mgnify:CR=1 FL=1
MSYRRFLAANVVGALLWGVSAGAVCWRGRLPYWLVLGDVAVSAGLLDAMVRLVGRLATPGDATEIEHSLELLHREVVRQVDRRVAEVDRVPDGEALDRPGIDMAGHSVVANIVRKRLAYQSITIDAGAAGVADPGGVG